MDGFQVKVDPGTLRAAAAEVTGLTRTLRDDFDELQNCVRQTARYWTGAAGEQYRREFESEKKETSEILALLGNYSVDLLSMAGIYEAAEGQNAQTTGALPSDIL